MTEEGLLHIKCRETGLDIQTNQQLRVFYKNEYVGDGFFEWDGRNRLYYIQSINQASPLRFCILDDPFHHDVQYEIF